MPELERVLDYLSEKGLDSDQPIALASMALRANKGDWAEAHSSLRSQANRFALNGDVKTAELVNLSAKIVRFYGRGY